MKQNHIGESIKHYRVQAGLSQQQLADALDYKTGTAISLIESGARGVDVSDISGFAKALGVNTSTLLGVHDEPVTFSTALRADADLTKKDKDDILNFYQYVKSNRKSGK
jgi:transcriptional regulator with XRE-family HTH domain